MFGITDTCAVVDKPIELGQQEKQAVAAYKSPYSLGIKNPLADSNTVATNATVSGPALHLQTAGPQGITEATDITSSETDIASMRTAPSNNDSSTTDVTLEASGGVNPSTKVNSLKRSPTDAELEPNSVSAKLTSSGHNFGAAGQDLPISLQQIEVMEINGYYLKKIVRDLTTERAENLQIKSISGRFMEAILLSEVFEK
jgi:hypothetical protein